MKRTLTTISTFILVAAFATVAAFADVTGDFKMASATYSNSGDADGGDVVVSGTVNHGAIQSGKSVVVEVSYGYSFEYQTTETINGITTTTIPARCPSSNPNDNACKHANSNSALFSPTITNTPYSYTVTHTFNGSSGMTAITAPTVTNGRLNPKGKITGYNWSSTESIVPSDSMVASELIPDGATLVSGSVKITSVAYTTYLKDSAGNQIADTVISGNLFTAAP